MWGFRRLHLTTMPAGKTQGSGAILSGLPAAVLFAGVIALFSLSFIAPSPAMAQSSVPYDPPSQGSAREQTIDPYSPEAVPRPRRVDPEYDSSSRDPYGDPVPRRYADPSDPNYGPPPARRYSDYDQRYDDRQYEEDPPYEDGADLEEPRYSERRSYSENEIVDAGHKFFGAVSRGLADAISYVFRSQGRPNGYILGEDAGGAFVAGIRYGEGWMYSKRWPSRKVYWQGPSVGYDFGGEGSKVMVLIYNLHDPYDILGRFAGVQGSAYLVGGVGVQFQKRRHVTLAPIRAGVGVRFGASVGYLKYTQQPTWNPF